MSYIKSFVATGCIVSALVFSLPAFAADMGRVSYQPEPEKADMGRVSKQPEQEQSDMGRVSQLHPNQMLTQKQATKVSYLRLSQEKAGKKQA